MRNSSLAKKKVLQDRLLSAGYLDVMNSATERDVIVAALQLRHEVQLRGGLRTREGL